MSFDCPSYCYENYFLVALSRYGLIRGLHCTSENPKQCLIHCIAEFRSVLQIEHLISGLYDQSNQGQTAERSLFAQGLELEYGLQKHLITSESCPNVSLLAELGKGLDLDIYVVCGLLPLRFLRIEGNNNEFDVLRFKFFQNDSPTKIVIGMIGLGIFHKLEQPSNDSSIWDSLSRRSIVVDNEKLIDNVIQLDLDYEDDRAMEDELIMEFDTQLEIESGFGQNTNRGTENVSSISMQEFVGRYLQYDDNGPNLDPESYNFPEKIDIGLTSREDIEGGQQLSRLEQVVDIDGFFGVFMWNESSVFKGNVRMCSGPRRASPREVNSFTKLLLDTHNGSDFQGSFFKIAICVTNFGIIDLYYSCFYERQDGLNAADEVINEVVKRAFDHGKIAKCRDEATGNLIHEGCTAHRFRENSDAYRSVERGNSEPVYDRSRYQCFAYHFGTAVERGLAQVDIRLTHDLCLVQAVGMKFVLLSPTVNGVMQSISEISEFFELNKMHSNFDLCFSTVGHCSDPEKSVKIT